MNVFEQSKFRNFRNLNLPVSALYLIAAPSTPEKVRDEVIERAEAGESMTRAKVKEAVLSIRAPCSRVLSSKPAPIAASDPEPSATVSKETTPTGNDTSAASDVAAPAPADADADAAKAEKALGLVHKAIDLVGAIVTTDMAFAHLKKAERKVFIERATRAVH
jgi:hypothetical protein